MNRKIKFIIHLYYPPNTSITPLSLNVFFYDYKSKKFNNYVLCKQNFINFEFIIKNVYNYDFKGE